MGSIAIAKRYVNSMECSPSWLRKWEEIEKEWGRSPRLLVQDWRANSTYRTICAALGVCDKTLRSWRKFWDLPIDVNDNGQDEFTLEDYKNSRKTEKAAKQLDFASFEDAYRYFKLRKHLTDPEIAKRLGVSVRSIVRRKPAELQGLSIQHTRRGRELR